MYYKYEDHGADFPIIGNEDLKPSTSNYYSASIESRKYINSSIEFYYNDVSNMIANRFVTDEDDVIVYQYHNYKDVNLYGLNVSLFLNPLKKVTLNSVYTYTEAESDYEDVVDGISAHSVNLKLKYNPFKSWDILFSSKFNSNKTVDYDFGDYDIRDELLLPAYSISDLTITKSFESGNYLKMGIKNIFDYVDKNDENFLSSYEPGRRFFVSINFKLSKRYNE